MDTKDWLKSCLRLHKNAALKRLELPYLYHIGRDELYEISNEAEKFLLRCNGSLKGSELDAEEGFVEYCLEEGLLLALPYPENGIVKIDQAPYPSLRYLELQLLHRCNLSCRHCYIGPQSENILSLYDALKITREFAENGGLRLLISGGEPLLYPYLKDFLKETKDLKIRRVLLTNGTLINEKNIGWLDVENIQFSLDGMSHGHEILRGKGTFSRTCKGIMAAKDAGIPISIATMIHTGNVDEFEEIKEFVLGLDATYWGIDVPCESGFLRRNQDLMVPYKSAARFMSHAYGGGYHGSSSGYACGRHLMTVLPTGMAVKCGFYENAPLGDALEGLISSWMKLTHIPLDQLECKGCAFIDECCGGCRFRAPTPFAPDPVMCAYYGIE